MTSPVKVLFVSHSGELSGAERCMLDFIANTNRRLISPCVVLPWEGPLLDCLNELGVPTFLKKVERWLPNKRKASIKHLVKFISTAKARCYALAHLVERNRIEVVYSNTVTIIDGALVAKRKKIPHVWHLHEYVEGNPNIRSYLPFWLTKRIISSLSDTIVLPSEKLNRHFGAMANAIVVRNGIQNVAPSFSCDEVAVSKLRQQLLGNNDGKIVTFVGSFTPVKDPLTFVKTAYLVKQSMSKVKFLMVGGGEELVRERVRRAVNELGLDKDVKILGFVNDVDLIYRVTDVLFSSSILESFGRVIVEAMLYGIAVVATMSGGPEEIIKNEQTGFLVPKRDCEGASVAIIRLLLDDGLLQSVTRKARDDAVKLYSMDKYVTALERVILETKAKAKGGVVGGKTMSLNR